MTRAEPFAGLTLTRFSQIGGTPAELLALRLQVELFEKGWATSTSYNWDDHALVLMDGGGAVAGIFWREVKWQRQVSVVLGGVLPAFRRRGLYRALFGELVRVVRAECPDAVEISSGYHRDNAASAAMHAALGRTVTHHLTRFELNAGGVA